MLAAIPTYAMQTGVIPISTCEDIDRRIQNFVWGSTDESRKVHLISWERICLPKEDGGLGLKMARVLNRAYMMKLAFLFMQDPERLWVKVLQNKYFRDTDAGLEVRKLDSQAALWRGLYKEWDSMLLGARSAIRNGCDTLFWTARWVELGSRLLDSVEDTDAALNLSDYVADYTNIDEQWDVEKLISVLSPDQVSLVVGMTLPRAESGEDQWVWGGETNGHFSIKSTYKLIYTQANSAAHDRWKLCWKWKGPNCICHFLWLTIQEKLLTNSERVKRHMTSNADCDHCQHPVETDIHMLRDCTFATKVWRLIGDFDIKGVDWQGNLIDWMGHGLRAGRATTGGLAQDSEGRCIFAYTMNLGNCSITRAEMRGAIEGLRRTWVAGYRKVVLQLDSQAVILLLSNEDDTRHHHALEMASFKELCSRN
ncbi:Putative ribonuclease H protein At1g65750 [Linum perenne]